MQGKYKNKEWKLYIKVYEILKNYVGFYLLFYVDSMLTLSDGAWIEGICEGGRKEYKNPKMLSDFNPSKLFTASLNKFYCA